MKIARSITLLNVALIALSLGFVGCKSKPQKPTTLMGPGSGKVSGESRSGMLGQGNQLQAGNFGAESATPATPSGIGGNETGTPQTSRNFEGWFEDRNAFKDQTVYFDYDKHNVKPSEVDKLKEVAHRMKNFQGMALRIEGHCDERGTEEYNRSLGDKRAQAVREFLASEGFDPTMMPTITFGEDKPADPGHTDAAFTKNRRGELILLSSRPHSGSGEQITDRVESRAPRNE